MASQKRVTGDGVDHKNETFLFTSESVGEGHPGDYLLCSLVILSLYHGCV